MKMRYPLIPLLISVALVGCEKNPEAKRDEVRQDAREASREIKSETAPARLKIKGNWNEAKGKLKQKYAELTDDDLLYVEGKEDELYGKLQKRLGKSREEVDKILEDL